MKNKANRNKNEAKMIMPVNSPGGERSPAFQDIEERGAAPPPVDECSTSDSDKTLDVASTSNLLSPYHSKVGDAKQQVPVLLGGGGNGVDNWTEASSVRSRRSRSRSHSRNRKENRRPSSVDSSVESRSHRRKSHRSRSRHNSDNESEASRVSESEDRNRSNSRRRRHRSSRDSSGSESDHQSSHRRSNRRNRRRSSQGSTYELVDSEAQWREIQERQGLQQSQTATVRPAASSTPVQQQPVQQATVRKATTNAVNVSSSSANDSLLDQSQSDLTTVETNSQVSSSRHRHHRKHNHRHHHKHRSHSRHSEKSVKPSLPSEIMPHLQFQLVDPPVGSTSDQLREIPYQVVTSQTQPTPSSAVHHTADDSNDHKSKVADNRKRHHLHPATYPEERKIISVDNDSPPPPYSPPQNVDALAQSLGSLSIPPASRSRGRLDINTNNSSLTHSRPARTAPTSNPPPPPIAARPPPAPIPGPKPNKPARPQGDFSSIQSSSSSSSYSPQYSMASAPSAHHPGNNAVANGYHYTQPGTAAGHAPLQPQYGNSNNSINHHNNMQYHHQENRRATTLPPPLLPPPPPASNSSASSSSSAFNGFHYPFAPQANAPAPISPHHVGLPLTGFSINNHSIPSPQVPTGLNHQQQAAKNSSGAPLALPRLSVPTIPAPSIHNSSSSSNGIHPMEKQNKSLMPMSPLANGVTVTNQLQSNLGDMLSRQTIQTKYVTRPQTPVTPQTFAINPPTSLPYYPGQYHQRLSQPQCQTMTLPGRGNRSGNNTRTNIQHCVMDGKFAIQPPPTFAFPDHNPQSANWHASLPRLVRHLPAAAQQETRDVNFNTAIIDELRTFL
ncbi:hypothetical protein DAPPUDRAFT_119454 [Daphnia pulex]|uniref:Uncharacterized protein n=1 Tax=Daphnia pulex TaxID=6669 RepID=E9HYK1_DAPPU|nr:hypothetical protein DAPPUDRAFT_119454 [Daphnia pulex]|eukprot:EFX63179.1 hypothetical protein DAPPUDRAFT_119454 [Daphnia pulex]